MITDSADYSPDMPDKPLSVDQLFQGIPVQSAGDLACEGIFDTDEELEEHLQHIYAIRPADLT